MRGIDQCEQVLVARGCVRKLTGEPCGLLTAAARMTVRMQPPRKPAVLAAKFTCREGGRQRGTVASQEIERTLLHVGQTTRHPWGRH